jgi:hypothetical protein
LTQNTAGYFAGKVEIIKLVLKKIGQNRHRTKIFEEQISRNFFSKKKKKTRADGGPVTCRLLRLLAGNGSELESGQRLELTGRVQLERKETLADNIGWHSR